MRPAPGPVPGASGVHASGRPSRAWIPHNTLTFDLFGEPLPTSVHTHETSPDPDNLAAENPPIPWWEKRDIARLEAAARHYSRYGSAFAYERSGLVGAPASSGETSRRHGWWEQERAAVLAAMSRAGFPASRLDRFQNCGSAAFILGQRVAPYRLRVASNKCRDRHCKPCQIERANKYAANLKKRLSQYAGRVERRFRFITLTLKTNEAPLDKQFRRLIRCFAALRAYRLGDVSRRRTRNWWGRYVVGGCYFLEATYRPAGWHVHAHLIVEGRFLPVDELRSLWKCATGDSSVVDVRELTGAEDAAAEVSKYASKGADAKLHAEGDRLAEWMIGTKSLRLCSTFGTWRGFRLNAPLDDFKPGEWRNLGREDDIRARAALGDVWARRIITDLEKDRAATRKERPPPVVSPKLAPTSHGSARAGAH